MYAPDIISKRKPGFMFKDSPATKAINLCLVPDYAPQLKLMKWLQVTISKDTYSGGQTYRTIYKHLIFFLKYYAHIAAQNNWN